VRVDGVWRVDRSVGVPEVTVLVVVVGGGCPVWCGDCLCETIWIIRVQVVVLIRVVGVEGEAVDSPLKDAGLVCFSFRVGDD